MTPAWTLDVFAALMLVVAAVSAARLVLARPWRRGSVVADTDIAHPLMAIAMAGTLAPGLTTLPAVVWEIIFAMMTAWFAERVAGDVRANRSRALAGGHCVPHLAHSAAMLYMFLALVPFVAGINPGMAGMGGSAPTTPVLHYPTLAFIFALILIGYSVWDLDHLSGTPRSYTLAPAGARGVREVLLSPGTTVGCRVVMGVTMTLMLLVMI
jgi:hypothetical protein